jgi:3-deoxy-D-manno-octulosonate 8-phosphate phosphatase (KDO 8-P phosphatase)
VNPGGRSPAHGTPLAGIRLLVLDVDGVLTDGRLYFGSEGEALKIFHVRDGHGLKLLQASGLQLAVVSGRRATAVAVRMRELGIATVHQGVADKVATVNAIATAAGIPLSAVACITDDTTDLPLMAAVGLAVAVADAHPAVLAAAHHITTLPGGQGAVRQLCDALLEVRREMLS